MLRKAIASIALLAASALPAHATVIFSDNFNAENGGTGVLNYTGFANWTVSSGYVDLIGNGFFDFQPGNGLYIDMDGSRSAAGTIVSLSLNLGPGDYALSYDLAGNHRNGATESVTASVETGLTSRTESLGASTPFTTFTDTFSLAS